MNAATAKHIVKQRFQALADQQRQQYYSTYDYLTGRPLAALAADTTTSQDRPAFNLP